MEASFVPSKIGRDMIERLRVLGCARDLSEGALRSIADVAIRKRIARGKCLWNMGDNAEFVGLLLSGAIEIVKISPQGKETCMGIFGPCNAIGISAVLKKSQYPAMARSIAKDTEVLKLYLRPLLQRSSHPAFEEISTWLRELLLSHEQVLRDKIDIVSMSRVEGRVVELFRQLSSRFGKKIDRSTFLIPIRLSKTQLARLVDIRVETMIRLLNAWKKEGLIDLSDDGMRILDFAALERKVREE